MKKEKDEPSLYITLPRRTYNPYEKIELEVAASKGKTPVSLSVRDAYGCDTLFDNGNILTEMLLASEVKGFIPNPGWYFEKDDETHRRALDLLLMTQGWRRFNWKDMAIKGEWEITQPAEQKQILTGRVYKYSWNPQEILDVFILKQILKQEEDFLSDPDRRENGALKRDVKIHAEKILNTRQIINEMLAENTGQKVEQVAIDTDRDYYMNPREAVDYGIIDRILEKGERH
jgi:hypothetical protein